MTIADFDTLCTCRRGCGRLRLKRHSACQAPIRGGELLRPFLPPSCLTVLPPPPTARPPHPIVSPPQFIAPAPHPMNPPPYPMPPPPHPIIPAFHLITRPSHPTAPVPQPTQLFAQPPHVAPLLQSLHSKASTPSPPILRPSFGCPPPPPPPTRGAPKFES